MLVWAKVMAEMIMASCMGPESITLMMLVNSITTIIIIIIIIKSIKNSLCPWQSPECLGPMGKKNKNHYRSNIRPTIKHGDMIHLFWHHPHRCFHLLVARSLSYITIRITRGRACESEISNPSHTNISWKKAHHPTKERLQTKELFANLPCPS